MSKSSKIVDSEQRTDTIVGIVTVVVVLALVAWLFVSISARGNAISAIEADGEARRGRETVFTAEVNSPKIKDGDAVKWYVNGEMVEEGSYVKGEPLKLSYTPIKGGQNYVTAKIGKYSQTAFVDVKNPKLTLSANNLTITYGEEIPRAQFACDGFVDDDCDEMMDYDGECYLCDDNDERLDCGKLNVGVYRLGLEQNCCFKDYDVDYVYGTLTVLPKKLNVCGNFVKTYDSCNVIENPSIKLEGVYEGDEVCAECDRLYFDNKNAGVNKTIMLANVELKGTDSCNYVLEEVTNGTILPKQVEIGGLSIRDKMYDGTTKAQIDKMGALDGVIEGDSVAIGSLELSFAEAQAGEQQIVLDNVSLIGADKDNYEVVGVDVESAMINNTLWNKIFVKNPVATASQTGS